MSNCLNGTEIMNEEELKKNFEKFKNGDLKARNKIIKSNIALVKYVAKRYNVETCDYEDLVSIGTIGLIKAVDAYDINRQFKFSTYAVRCISNEILMSIKKNKLKIGNFETVNINEPIAYDYEGHELKYIDVIEDKNSDFVTKIIDDYVKKDLLNIIDSLTEKEKKIVILYFCFDGVKYTQKEIAGILGVSQSTVSKLRVQILAKIRVKIENLYLKEEFVKSL